MMETEELISSDAERLKNLVIIGDRVLIKPKSSDDKTKTGLFLPPGVQEKESIRSGYVMKTGPGYPVQTGNEDSSDIWKDLTDNVKYIPLQVKVGDLALFLQKNSIEVVFKEEKFFVVPQHSILMVERDESLFE